MSNEHWHRPWRLVCSTLATVLLGVLAAGCGAARPATVDHNETYSQLRAALPPLGSQTLRRVSAGPSRFLLGAQFRSGSLFGPSAVTGGGGVATFSPDYDPAADPPGTTLAWAMYLYDLSGQDVGTPALRYGFSEPPADWGDAWLALADWLGQRWVFLPCGPSGVTQLEAAQLARCITQDDQLLCAVVLGGTDAAILDWLAVGGNLPPQASYELDPATAQTGEQVNFSCASSSDRDGQITKYELDFGEGAGFEDLGLSTDAQHSYAAAGTYTTRLRVTDDGGLNDTATIPLEIGAAPHGVIAYLSADPAGGGVPLTVYFDASASLPGTGQSITGYDFDFDGDGEVDQSGASPLGSFRYDWAGEYTASVLVIDSGLGVDTVTVPLSLTDARSWQAGLETGGSRSFALFEVDGRPALAYENGYGQVVYRRALDNTGRSWPPEVLIDISADACGYMDAAVIGGHPSFVYYDHYTQFDDRVKYAYSEGAAGMSEGDWGLGIVAELGYLGAEDSWLSLADIGSRPGLLYVSADQDAINYKLAADYSGQAWSDAVPLSSIEFGNETLSLAVVDGRPAAAYFHRTDSSHSELYYRRANDALGSSWAAAETIIAPLNWVYGSFGIDLHQADGLIGLAGQQTNSLDLYFFRRDAANPGSWIATEAEYSSNRSGSYPTWAMLGGRPVIASCANYGDGIRFSRADDPLGDVWNSQPQLAVDSSGSGDEIGEPTQMIIIDGTPVVAYHNATAGTVCTVALVE